MLNLPLVGLLLPMNDARPVSNEKVVALPVVNRLLRRKSAADWILKLAVTVFAVLPIASYGQPGTKLREFTTGQSVDSSPAISSNGVIYVGSVDGLLYAFNPDGSTNQVFATGGLVSSAPTIGPDNTIYVGSQGQRFYCFNSDGSTKWSYSTTSRIAGSPAIGSDGTVYFGDSNGKLYALNGADGSKQWEFVISGAMLSAPIIAGDGTIIVGSDDGRLYSVFADGIKHWTFAASGTGMAIPAAIGPDGTIYTLKIGTPYGANEGIIYALNRNGAVRWERHFTGEPAAAAVAPDGTIYVSVTTITVPSSGEGTGKLVALNPNGNPIWETQLGNKVGATPCIGMDGNIYVGTSGSAGPSPSFYSISPGGTTNWIFACSNIIISSAVLSTNGVVYFGCGDGKMYAIQASSGIAEGGWPMVQKNPLHTGRAFQNGFQPLNLIPSILHGVTRLTMKVEIGYTYHVEYSTNLSSWLPLVEFNAENGSTTYIDFFPKTEDMRFYRMFYQPDL